MISRPCAILVAAWVAAMAALSGCGDGQTGPQSCARNSDCVDELAQCVEGACRRECVEDRDCAAGLFCQEGLCLEGSVTCRGDEDCVFNEECQQGLCVAIAGFCERTRDCPEDEACSANTHTCVAIDGRGGDCRDDRDCFAEEICAGGRCATRGDVECVRHSDCGADELCVGDRCESECVEDRDCPSGQSCDRGRCSGDVEPEPEPEPEPEGPACGDGACDQGESPAGCPQDCAQGGDCRDTPGVCTPSQECCAGACVARGQCPSDYWQICDARADCSTTLCLGDPNTGLGHCTERCVSRQECPQSPASLCIGSQHIVTNQPGGSELIGLCFADDTGVSCSPLGQNACFDGICIDRRPNNQVEGQCSLRCQRASDCLPGYACGPKEFSVQGQAQLINVCVPVGTACQGVGIEAANQCYSGICLTDDQNNNLGLCTTLCGSNAACPAGWGCTPVDAQNSVCLPL